MTEASLSALLIVAIAVGLGNFCAAIGIGLSHIDMRTRIRVALFFGIFEACMPLVGLLFGRSLATALGGIAPYAGGGLLIVMGNWTAFQSLGTQSEGSAATQVAAVQWSNLGTLAMTAFALSMDNLVVGFSLGVAHTPIIAAIVVFIVVSLGLAFLGLEVGRRIGVHIEEASGVISGVVLVIVGILIITHILSIGGH